MNERDQTLPSPAKPATEIEIAAAIERANGYDAMTIRRLAFERDALREKLKRSSPLPQFVEAGWKFRYDQLTRFVNASHPLGGRFPIASVSKMTRAGGDPVNWHEVGHAIAALLNGEQSR